MLQLSRLSRPHQLDKENLVSPLALWDDFEPSSFLLTVKGAPEVLLKHCSHVLNPSGGPPSVLEATERERIAQIQENWSGQGQRVLLLARRVVTDEYLARFADNQTEQFGDLVDGYMADLIVVGLVGLIDPLKPDIRQTVK